MAKGPMISDLKQVSHKDVRPMYSKEEILDKLASAVYYLRKSVNHNGIQQLEMEFQYSIAKALLDPPQLINPDERKEIPGDPDPDDIYYIK